MPESEPEINLARRIITKFSLHPPIDVWSLAEKYAHVETLEIPFDVDGITLNLKIPGKKPHILLNASATATRKRFTLAHEIGHIVIPWHVGTIIDITSDQLPDPSALDQYWIVESEANRFASELLMPASWVAGLIEESDDPEVLMNSICDGARVSPAAAMIKLVNALPPGYVYTQLESDGTVTSSGRSRGTLANQPPWGTHIDPRSLFPSAQRMFRFNIGLNDYVWWKFPASMPLPRSSDAREWREILDEIVVDIGIPTEEAKKFKSQINGVIAFANGQLRHTIRTRESIYSACLQRFHSKPDLQKFIGHRAFTDFLVKRVWDLAG